MPGSNSSSDDGLVIELKSSGLTAPLDGATLPTLGSGGGNPVTPVPQPRRSFFERNSRLIAIGAGVAIAPLLATMLYLLVHDSSKSQAAQLLVKPSNEIGNISAQVANSPSIGQLNEAGDRVDRYQRIVDNAVVDVQDIGNDDVRSATLDLLTAESSLLVAYERLDRVSRAGSSGSLRAIDRVERATRDIGGAVSRLKALELDEQLNPYPNERLLTRAVRRLEQLLGR